LIFKLHDIEPLQVQGHHQFYSVWSMYINICLNLCDPKGSHPDEACEVLFGVFWKTPWGWCPCAKTCKSFIPVM